MSSDATESPGMFELMTWATVHKRNLIRGGIALAVIVVGLGVGKWYFKQKETAADRALFALHHPPGEEKPGPKAADLQRVAQEHGGTAAGERASLLAASALFGEGSYAAARSEFERFRQAHPDSAMIPEALYGIAAALDAEGKPTEALAAYQDLVTRYPNSGASSRARLSMALIHEGAAKPDLALKLYDELNRPNDRSLWVSDALDRRSRLLAKHPELNVELANTNAPKVTITRLPNTNAPAGGTNAAATNLPILQIQQPAPAR